MRILLVEDDPDLGPLLKSRLEELGFGTDLVVRGEEALLVLPELPYDATVLDLRLPDMDGLAVLRQLRGKGLNLPVLILTARDGIDDRVLGLDSGADDYLTKPFSSSELIARIKALLRRPGATLGQTLQAGQLHLDTIAREIWIGDSPVVFPRRELMILENLMRRLNQVVPLDLLEEKLYGLEEVPASNPIPVHVHQLRRKLKEHEAGISIHTVRGLGYLLQEDRG